MSSTSPTINAPVRVTQATSQVNPFLPPSSLLVDWVLAEALCVKQGDGGRTRYILKDTIRYLPLYGWVLGEVGTTGSGQQILSLCVPHMQRGGIFVKRCRGRDQEKFIT